MNNLNIKQKNRVNCKATHNNNKFTMILSEGQSFLRRCNKLMNDSRETSMILIFSEQQIFVNNSQQSFLPAQKKHNEQIQTKKSKASFIILSKFNVLASFCSIAYNHWFPLYDYINYDMKRFTVLVLLLIASFSFQIEQEVKAPPRTFIGNDSIACHPQTTPQNTNGFATYFSDNSYACGNWNGKAKSLPDCFVALNGVCGMKQTYCDKCILMFNTEGGFQKCRVIDFCDPKNCDFLDSGHIDILDNSANAHYKFVDKGKNVVPYTGAGGQPILKWHWTAC